MPSEVHLSRAQKWDLTRFAVAAVASSVFFSLPMLLVPARSADSGDTRTPSVTVSEQITVAGVSEPTATPNPPQTGTTEPLHTDVVAVVTSTALARITRPTVATSEKTSIRPVQLRARANAPVTAPTQSATLSRRLARFIAGDGKYGPKPFPTLTASGM
jgi:hypothetical protein